MRNLTPRPMERIRQLKWQIAISVILLVFTFYCDLMGAFKYGAIMVVTYFPYAIFIKPNFGKEL